MNVLRLLENLFVDSDIYEAEEEFNISSDCLEILCPIKGELIDSEGAASSALVCILPPGKTYEFKTGAGTLLFRMALSMRALAENFSYEVLMEMAADIRKVDSFELIRIIRQYISRKEISGTENAALAASMISELEKIYRPEEKLGLTEQQARLFNEIIALADENDENLRLDDMAEKLGITPQYLTSFWKKLTGRPLLKYIKETEEKRRELCESYKNKKRLLRIKGMKRSHSQKSIEECRAYAMKPMFKYMDDKSKDKIKNIVASPEGRQPVKPVWLRLINLGYAKELYRGRAFHILERMQSDIGFQYGRICMLFDLIEMYSLGGKIYYSYSKIFSLIDTMLENNMRPFVELGNKQFRIQFSINEHFSPEDAYDPNEYFEKVIELFQGFLRECINRYGYSEVELWRFEIGYPPFLDADPGKKKEFPFAKYSYYFKRIKNIIKSMLPDCMIGGPGFNSWGNIQELPEIIEAMEKLDAGPDFLTAYIYPLTDNTLGAVVSENPNVFEERMRYLTDFVKNSGMKREIWITEFNSNLSSRTLINDSSYQAAFLTNVVKSALKLGIAALGYYLMSDVDLRFADNNYLLFGGWGLFTDTNIPKPIFHAYSLLSKLGYYLLSIGDNYIVTSNSAAQIQCIVFSYQHLGEKFRSQNMTIEDVNAEYSNETVYEREKIQVDFPYLTAGKYEIETYTIGRKSGNLLYEWYRVGFETPLQTDDNSVLAKRSEMIPELRIVTLKEEGTLSIDADVEKGEVKLFNIRLQKEVQKL